MHASMGGSRVAPCAHLLWLPPRDHVKVANYRPIAQPPSVMPCGKLLQHFAANGCSQQLCHQTSKRIRQGSWASPGLECTCALQVLSCEDFSPVLNSHPSITAWQAPSARHRIEARCGKNAFLHTGELMPCAAAAASLRRPAVLSTRTLGPTLSLLGCAERYVVFICFHVQVLQSAPSS